SVPRILPAFPTRRSSDLPDDPVTGHADGSLGEFLLGRLEFLQAHDVGCLLVKPAQQIGQAGPDAVDVVGDDSHDAYGSESADGRSEEHTSELQSLTTLAC